MVLYVFRTDPLTIPVRGSGDLSGTGGRGDRPVYDSVQSAYAASELHVLLQCEICGPLSSAYAVPGRKSYPGFVLAKQLFTLNRSRRLPPEISSTPNSRWTL